MAPPRAHFVLSQLFEIYIKSPARIIDVRVSVALPGFLLCCWQAAASGSPVASCSRAKTKRCKMHWNNRPTSRHCKMYEQKEYQVELVVVKKKQKA